MIRSSVCESMLSATQLGTYAKFIPKQKATMLAYHACTKQGQLTASIIEWTKVA